MSAEYGEARGWTGDDDREFGPYYEDEERCPICGASEDEDCTEDCYCTHCVRFGKRPAVTPDPPDADGEAFRGEEAAAYERDQMADVYRELK